MTCTRRISTTGNKLTGISFNFLRPDQNALMVAWRYNVADNDFEIAPYYNVDLARILPNESTEVIKIPIGQTFDFTVNYSGIIYLKLNSWCSAIGLNRLYLILRQRPEPRIVTVTNRSWPKLEASGQNVTTTNCLGAPRCESGPRDGC
jgi:hypothetical protein